MTTKVNNLGVKISDFCFNENATRMAVATGKEVQVYHSNGKGWELVHTLTNHQLHVSGVDWDHQNDRLVSISHDRNAFVWTYDEDETTWKPALVVVRCNRSLLCVKWSPFGNKFAIGAADKSITVCYYDASQNWWVTKKAKKSAEANISGSVTCLDWHENNMHVVAGTASNNVILYMCYVKECEKKPSKDGDIKYKAPFSQVWKGTTMSRVTAVRFVAEKDGQYNNASCIATDEAACIYFFDSTEGSNAIWTVATPHLAFTSLLLPTADTLVVGGFGFEPLLYSYTAEDAKEKKQLDPKKEKKKKEKKGNLFQNLDKLGQAGAVQNTILTKHQNTITNIRVCGPKTLVTGGICGRIIQWTVSDM